MPPVIALLFAAAGGTEVVRNQGTVADEFMALGEFVASGACRTRNFSQYRQESLRKKGS